MFGNILIDKLRISKKVVQNFNCSEAKAQLDHIMSKHFKVTNYTINYSKTYFRVTFTPTLYLNNVKSDENKQILNLEMISEEILLELLTEIYKILGDSAVITWIDLTKNILIEESACKCIETISKWQVKYPYKKHLVTSRGNNTTLTLSPLTRKNLVNCKNPNRRITFYSKITELKSKSKIRFLDNVQLSQKEIKQLPEVNYQKETGRLYLKDLNIVRCEQRYKFTNNIKKITQFLTGFKNDKKLTLPLLLNLLKRRELYNKLDKFYSRELRQYVFYDDVYAIKDIKLNKQESRIVEIVNKYNIDIAEFQHLFSDVGYKENFNRSAKKIFYHTRGEYYNKLYEKFGL